MTGALLAVCALSLLYIALPAGGQPKKQRQHHRSARVDRIMVLIHRHHVGIDRRRAVVGRQGTSVLPGGTPRPTVGVAPAVALPAESPGGATPRVASVAPTEDPPPSPPIADPEDPPPVGLPAEPEEPVPTEPATPPGEEGQPDTPSPPQEEPSTPDPAEEPAPTEPTPPPPAPDGPTVYWGASIGDQLTGTQAPWDMEAVSKFEATAGKKLSLVNFFAPFANCSSSPCSFYDFPAGVMENVREHGAIPVFSWSSQSIPSKQSEPDFQLSDVIAGTYDSYIRRFAEDARDWGHPFFLRFNWEMNGGWFPWAEGVNGNQPGEFVAAWRHVHDIFSSIGADNATWVWCPNIDPDGIFQDLSSLYPGDDYVDWTGLDGYNWGTNPAKPDRWRSFDELYGSTYHRIVDTIAPSKSMLIGEIGSTEYGGSKAGWIEDALAKIPRDYPKIDGLLWFDTFDDGMDWPIETSSGASSAFAGGIQSSAYATNGYASLAGGPVQPPN